jgi:VWFA-related protein
VQNPALSPLGERVDRTGVFFSRGGPGEGVGMVGCSELGSKLKRGLKRVSGLSQVLTIFICGQLLVLAQTASPNAEAWSSSQEAKHNQDAIVTLPVLVLDRHGRPVMDLNQNELKLYEGKEEQSIESISRSPEAPAEIGFLIDISLSEAGPLRVLKLQDAKEVAGELLHTGDLAFVLTFAEHGSLVSSLTSDLGRIGKALQSAFNTQPHGGTALYDAIFWACSEELTTLSGLKALIIFSDMEDNASHHTQEQALAEAQRSGTLIYPILLRETRSRGGQVAKSLASNSGGVSFAVYKLEALKETFRSIRADLDSTYVIAYRPKSHRPASVKVRCTRKGVKIIAPDRRY